MAESKKREKPRRIRGEGALYQRHFETCPPKDESGVRPKHSCKGLWVGSIDLGWHGGKRIRKSVTGTSKKAVQDKFLELKKTIEKGGGLTADTNVEEWLTHWLNTIASERVKEYTLEGYESKVRTWLIPYLGKYRLDQLKQDHIRALYRVMKEQGKSNSLRRQVHAILHRALVVAEQEGRISRNPAEKMDAPSTEVTNRKPLTIVQAKQILSQLDGNPLAARWVAALLQGMRQGECLALKWDDIDFVNDTISIHRGQVRLKKQGLTTTTPKSKNSIRTIPMIGPMKYALENTERRGDFVFYGEATDSKRDWTNWKELLVSTGVCDAGMAKGDMPELAAARTTTATLLRDAGVDGTVIRDILGHSQVSVTQESYMRTDALTMARAMLALEVSVQPEKSSKTRKAISKKITQQPTNGRASK